MNLSKFNIFIDSKDKKISKNTLKLIKKQIVALEHLKAKKNKV